MITNPEELRRAVKAIEAEPEHWDQAFWVADEKFRRSYKQHNKETILDTEACGTTMCLTGHLVKLAGYRMSATLAYDENGVVDTIPRLAAKILGLEIDNNDEDVDLADSMFFSAIGSGYNNPGAEASVAVFKVRLTQLTGITFD